MAYQIHWIQQYQNVKSTYFFYPFIYKKEEYNKCHHVHLFLFVFLFEYYTYQPVLTLKGLFIHDLRKTSSMFIYNSKPTTNNSFPFVFISKKFKIKKFYFYFVFFSCDLLAGNLKPRNNISVGSLLYIGYDIYLYKEMRYSIG